MHAEIYDTPGDQARLVVRNGPSWLGPALRGAIMLDVPVLAPDVYTEYWAQMALPSEVHWKRIQLLPMRGGAAKMSIRASNLLHSCIITSDPYITLSLGAVAPIDEFRDPVLPAVAGHRYSMEVTRCFITAMPDPNGPWSLARCSPGGMDFCTSVESLCIDVHRWSLAMGNAAPLATITRSLWRFMEPTVAGGMMGWSSVCAVPDTWKTTWDPDRGELTFRRLSRSECAADAAAVLQRLRCLTSVNIRAEGSTLRMIACANGAPDAAVRCDLTDEIVTIVMLATASDESPSLDEFGGKTMQFAQNDDETVQMKPCARRDDSLQLYASSIHVDPPEARPESDSDADWKSIPIVRMRRGDSIRASVACALGVGAVHSKFASACGGVSSVFENGTLTLDIETVGQLTARRLLKAACGSFAAAVQLFSRSIDHVFLAPRPSLHFPARTIRMPPKPPPMQPGPTTFQCVTCGSGPTTLSICGKCGRSVMEKMRRRDAVLTLM